MHNSCLQIRLLSSLIRESVRLMCTWSFRKRSRRLSLQYTRLSSEYLFSFLHFASVEKCRAAELSLSPLTECGARYWNSAAHDDRKLAWLDHTEHKLRQRRAPSLW